MEPEQRHWPTEITIARDRRQLTVAFEDGSRFAILAELLRVESPSAEVQGHRKEEKIVVAGKRNVMILGVEPVGHYAVRLTFDDMHSTGIFTWDYLHALGSRQDALMADYVAKLEALGLSRDRPAAKQPHRH